MLTNMARLMQHEVDLETIGLTLCAERRLKTLLEHAAKRAGAQRQEASLRACICPGCGALWVGAYIRGDLCEEVELESGWWHKHKPH